MTLLGPSEVSQLMMSAKSTAGGAGVRRWGSAELLAQACEDLVCEDLVCEDLVCEDLVCDEL